MFYEMLTATRLFLGETDLATLKNVKQMKVPNVVDLRPDTPKEIEKIVLKALQRRVNRRYQSAAEMAGALEQFDDSFFEEGGRAALQGFFQYLYPRANLYRDKQLKKQAIEKWSARVTRPTIGVQRWLDEEKRTAFSWFKVAIVATVVIVVGMISWFIIK